MPRVTCRRRALAWLRGDATAEPGDRRAIHAFAAGVLDGSLDLASTDTVATAAALARLPGVEAWRAEYIAMRALGEPDAFPAGDPELRRAAGGDRTRDLVRRARAWRPWRAYAAMLLETLR
jgi:AraC family transcriptional regulator of adaptative response / DNA-3-methyladenine glycosylase II